MLPEPAEGKCRVEVRKEIIVRGSIKINMPVKTIIHGHFYQPPREDPWTDQIEDQPSAYPYKNWNVRIAAECYAPNSFSRVLDHRGKIIDIINNYQYLSFNFGPTLLSWMEKNDNDAYRLILEADKKSIAEHNGHGNAIAQIYNHVIMPLQSYEDKKTEIIWGLMDFERRFGRKSEGIWLSETAVDYNTIDLLIEFGIKFIILSPHQALCYKKLEDHEWINSADQPISTRRAYKVRRDHGEIAVFYFDKRLSTAVSFEHLLHDSNNFATRIMQNVAGDDEVVIIASDGEIFGHHEAYGDMCLANLIREYHINQQKIELLNFGEYLELFPPEYETSISLGDEGKGSSWSCFHGVGRWYRDCGCHTGGREGWTQEWRGPLRDAFDALRMKIDEIFVKELEPLVHNPWDLRNGYIEYILNDYNLKNTEFLNKHLKSNINSLKRTFILSLLEVQKNALFMYTSCAWFFTELTGIETVQNIKYAFKAITMLEKLGYDLKPLFEEKMEYAKSNIPKFKNGKWILENWVYPNVHDFPHIANNFVALYSTGVQKATKDFSIFYKFTYENFALNKLEKDKTIYAGHITVRDMRWNTSKDYNYIFHLKHKKSYKIYIFEKEEKELFNKIKKELASGAFNAEDYKKSNLIILSEKDLLNDIKKFVIEYNYKEKIGEMIGSCVNLFSDIKPLLFYYKNMEVTLPEIYKSFLKLSAETVFYNLSKELTGFPDRETLLELIHIFDLINYFSVNVDAKKLKDKFSMILYENLLKGDKEGDPEIFRKAIILIEFCHKVKLVIEKSKSENLVYKFLNKNVPLILDKINSSDNEEARAKYMLELRNLIILADNFNINTDNVKRSFFENFKQIKSFSSLDLLK